MSRTIRSQNILAEGWLGSIERKAGPQQGKEDGDLTQDTHHCSPAVHLIHKAKAAKGSADRQITHDRHHGNNRVIQADTQC